MTSIMRWPRFLSESTWWAKAIGARRVELLVGNAVSRPTRRDVLISR
jgi:hypothetical protein